MAVSMNTQMANREVCNLVFVDYANGKPFLDVDYANVTTTELTGEVTYAYGGWGHPKRIAFNGERGGTITIETQITPFKLYSLITGGSVTTSGVNWLKREVVTATAADTLTISDTSATAVSILQLDDGEGDVIEGTASSGTVTATGVAVGKRYACYYAVTLSDATKISIKSTTFPGYFTVYAETKMKMEDGTDALYRMIAYKCSPQSNFTMEFSNNGDPGTVTVTCDLLADKEDRMLDMILIDE